MRKIAAVILLATALFSSIQAAADEVAENVDRFFEYVSTHTEELQASELTRLLAFVASDDAGQLKAEYPPSLLPNVGSVEAIDWALARTDLERFNEINSIAQLLIDRQRAAEDAFGKAEEDAFEQHAVLFSALELIHRTRLRWGQSGETGQSVDELWDLLLERQEFWKAKTAFESQSVEVFSEQSFSPALASLFGTRELQLNVIEDLVTRKQAKIDELFRLEFCEGQVRGFCDRVDAVLQLRLEGIAQRRNSDGHLCADGNEDACESLKRPVDQEESFTQSVVEQMRKDYSVLQQLAYGLKVALNDQELVAKACKVDHWIDLKLEGSCIETIKTALEAMGGESRLYEGVIQRWIGYEAEVADRAFSLRNLGCKEEPIPDCSSHPATKAISYAIGGGSPFDDANRAIVKELQSSIGPLLHFLEDFGNQGIKVATLDDGWLEINVGIVGVSNKNTRSLSLSLEQVRQVAAPAECSNPETNSVPCVDWLEGTRTGARLEIRGEIMSADWASVRAAQNLEDMMASLTSSGMAHEWIVDSEEMGAWISSKGDFEFLEKMIANAATSGGVTEMVESYVGLVWPWGHSQIENYCSVTWEDVSKVGYIEECLKEKSIEYAQGAVARTVEAWLGAAEYAELLGNTLDIDDLLEDIDVGGLGITNANEEGVTFRIDKPVAIETVMNWEGALSVKDEEALTEALIERALRSVPYLKFTNRTIEEGAIVVDIAYQAPGSAAISIGRGRISEGAIQIETENIEVDVPALGKAFISMIGADIKSSEVSITVMRLVTEYGVEIGELGVRISENGSIDLSIGNAGAFENSIRRQLRKLGLVRTEVSSSRWDDDRQAFVVDIELPSSETAELVLDESWKGNVQSLLTEMAEAGASDYLDGFFSIEDLKIDPEQRVFGSLRFKKACSVEELAQCELSIEEAVADACSLWTGRLTGDGVETTSSGDCIAAWLNRRWSADTSIGIEALEIQDDLRTLEVRIRTEVNGKAVEGKSHINLGTGRVLFVDDFDSQVKAIIENELADVLGIDDKIQRLIAVCDGAKGNLEKNSFIKRDSILVDGKDSCGGVNWRAKGFSGNYDVSFALLVGGTEVGVSGVLLAPSQGGIRFNKAKVSEEQLYEALDAMIGSSLRSEYKVVQANAANGLIVEGVVPIGLFPGRPKENITIEIVINNRGVSLETSFEEVLIERLADLAEETILNKEVIIAGTAFSVVEITPSWPYLILNVESNSELFQAIGQPKIKVNIKTGEIEPPTIDDVAIGALANDLKDKLEEAAENYMNNLFGGKSLVSAVGTRMVDCESGDVSKCHMRTTIQLDLSKAIGLSLQAPIGDLSIYTDREPVFSNPSSVSIPIGGPYFAGPVSLADNTIKYRPGTFGVGTDLSFAKLDDFIKIDATLTIDEDNKEITVEGVGVLLTYVPIGYSKSVIAAEPLSAASSIHVGGALKKILSLDGCVYVGDTDCAVVTAELECKSLTRDYLGRGCGSGQLFQLLKSDIEVGVNPDLSFYAESKTDLIIKEDQVRFWAGPNLSRPQLEAEFSTKIEDIDIGSIAIRLNTGGAGFRIKALGLSVGLVVQNLHNMDGRDLEKLILALLLPDLDLKDLLDALLSGNVTINPFSSFGKGGGSSTGDGGDGGDGGVGGSGYGKYPATNTPGNFNGTGGSSVGDFKSSEAGKRDAIVAIHDGSYDSSRFPRQADGGEVPVGIANNFTLIPPGKHWLEVRKAGGRYEIYAKSAGKPDHLVGITEGSLEGIEIIRGDTFIVPEVVSWSDDRHLILRAKKDDQYVFIYLGADKDRNIVSTIDASEIGVTEKELKDKFYTERPMSAGRSLLGTVLNDWGNCLSIGAPMPGAPILTATSGSELQKSQGRGSRRPISRTSGIPQYGDPVLPISENSEVSEIERCEYQARFVDYDDGVIAYENTSQATTGDVRRTKVITIEKTSGTVKQAQLNQVPSSGKGCYANDQLRRLTGMSAADNTVTTTAVSSKEGNVVVSLLDRTEQKIILNNGCSDNAVPIVEATDKRGTLFPALMGGTLNRSVNGLVALHNSGKENLKLQQDSNLGYVLSDSDDVFFAKTWCDNGSLRKVNVSGLYRYLVEDQVDADVAPNCTNNGIPKSCVEEIWGGLDEENFASELGVVNRFIDGKPIDIRGMVCGIHSTAIGL